MVTMAMPGRASATPKMGVREMLQTRGAVITAIVCGTVLGLGLLAVVGFLLYSGSETGALLTIVNAVLTAAVYAKLRTVGESTTRVEQATNGQNSRLMDAALKDKPTG